MIALLLKNTMQNDIYWSFTYFEVMSQENETALQVGGER